MKKTLFILGAIVLLVALSPARHAKADLTPANIIEQTNEYRQTKGLGQLKENSKLDQAAELKAQDMLDNQYWAHESPTGVKGWDWIKKTGYGYQSAGENLAVYFTSTPQLMDAWEKSPGHDANLRGKDYTEIGVAVVPGTFKGYKTYVIVQMFGQPFIHKSTLLLPKLRPAIIIQSGSQAESLRAICLKGRTLG